jgi:endonuclease/exonuclease/phosphatase family metal-dependent hydrolase
MRIATYNVANLFERARALDFETWAEGRATLETIARVSGLLARPRYTPSIVEKIEAGLVELGLGKSDTGKLVELRQNRGKLRRRVDGQLRVVAKGRDDWWGWLELRRGTVDAVATQLTARVIRELHADVLGVVEAESRPALAHFVEKLVCTGGERPGPVMLIEGNDTRGIDVGLVLRHGYRIVRTLSHLDDEDAKGRMFRRDCSEHEIEAPDGRRLVVLVNHFKSQGYGRPEDNDGLRLRQARRVAEIYRGLRAAGHAAVAVLGDLNDDPRAAPLAPLLVDTDLRDVSTHPRFDHGGFPGTHGACRAAADKLDYILLSPSLFDAVRSGGVDRRGIWAAGRQEAFGIFPELTGPARAASDHGAVWVELDG